MYSNNIANKLLTHLKVPHRLKNVVSSYILSLALKSPKHTQTSASKLSGLHKAQFSRLLSTQSKLAKNCLNDLSQEFSSKQERKPLIPNTPWTVALIIDSTLHKRSSLHISNVHKFNHGGGYVVGHLWTNILLLVGEQKIPLPPIAFFTKKECRERKISYETELDRVAKFINNLDLAPYLGSYKNSEVVVLMDSGYDCKKIENKIIDRGWDFIIALKPHRVCKSGNDWLQVRNLFRVNKRWAPQKTVGFQTTRSKKGRKKFSTRRLDGFMNGVFSLVSLICSKKIKGKGNRYLVCSNQNISTKAIMKAYTKRWEVELFHREIKQDLGLMDAGVKNFDSLHSHLHWVYCTYLILKILGQETSRNLRESQFDLEKQKESDLFKQIIKRSTRFSGNKQVKDYCLQALEKLKVA